MRVGLGPFADSPSGLAVGSVDTARGLRAQGVDVTLFALGHAHVPPQAEQELDRVVRLESLPRPMRGKSGGDAVFVATKRAISHRWANALVANPVDLVHSFSPGCIAALPARLPALTQAWFHPPKLVPRMRTMLPFQPRFPPLFAAHALVDIQAHLSDRLGYRRADLILVNTPTAERGFRARGFPACCVPPAIEVPNRLPTREPGAALRVAFCAHPLTNPRKGLRYLLDAIPLVRGGPLELTLVGGGGEAFGKEIQRARRAGVKVELLGRVPRAAYLEHLARRTDLLAFMSLYEEWGYALLEALSQGVPAVALNLYPVFDILDDDTGLLVEPDPAAVARGLDSALDGALPTPERVLESTRRRYSTDVVVPRLVEAYEEMSAKGRV